MPELGWVKTADRPPAQPGAYLVRQDLEVEQLPAGRRNIRMLIERGEFDGTCWTAPITAEYWRDLPAHMKG